MAPDFQQLETKAKIYWTDERLQQVCGDKNFLLQPKASAVLLYQIGLVDEQAHMDRRQVRKFHQVNHMLRLLQAELEDLVARHAVVRLIDIGCGNSYLTLLVGWYLIEVLQHRCEILGVDRNAAVIDESKARARALGWEQQLRFYTGSIDGKTAQDLWQETFGVDDTSIDAAKLAKLRFHMVVALHACDTATDEALAFAVKNQADYLAAAPCCQAELARQWKDVAAYPEHPLRVFFRNPNLRRETAAQFTDALRVSLLKMKGYEVTVTEFVESKHTPKNRLIKGQRLAKFNAEAEREYQDLLGLLDGKSITLDRLLKD